MSVEDENRNEYHRKYKNQNKSITGHYVPSSMTKQLIKKINESKEIKNQFMEKSHLGCFTGLSQNAVHSAWNSEQINKGVEGISFDENGNVGLGTPMFSIESLKEEAKESLPVDLDSVNKEIQNLNNSETPFESYKAFQPFHFDHDGNDDTCQCSYCQYLGKKNPLSDKIAKLFEPSFKTKEKNTSSLSEKIERLVELVKPLQPYQKDLLNIKVEENISSTKGQPKPIIPLENSIIEESQKHIKPYLPLKSNPEISYEAHIKDLNKFYSTNAAGCFKNEYATKTNGEIKSQDGFVTKDSGERQKFESGMVRDTTKDKIDYSLLFDGDMLHRWAGLLTRGAVKYAKRNWMKATGKEELERFRESATRHFFQWMFNETDEDHAAAVLFNINGYEFVKSKLEAKNDQ